MDTNGIEFVVKGSKLVITVDISPEARKTAPMTSTRRSLLLASTRGVTKVDGSDLSIGLNVMCKPN